MTLYTHLAYKTYITNIHNMPCINGLLFHGESLDIIFISFLPSLIQLYQDSNINLTSHIIALWLLISKLIMCQLIGGAWNHCIYIRVDMQ